MSINYSFIVPVYNRPEEVRELLQSILEQENYKRTFEVVLVEDGSQNTSQSVVETFKPLLEKGMITLTYLKKKNTGQVTPAIMECVTPWEIIILFWTLIVFCHQAI